MSRDVPRAYVSPLRATAAAATRARILAAAKASFERSGWGGATLALIAAEAEVSPKTVQAQFGTKAKLLADTVDFAIRRNAGGDLGTRRGTAQAIKAASDARRALELHASMSTQLNSRAARLAGVVEAGAADDPALSRLWERMRENMRFGVRWAAEVVTAKPGLRTDLHDEAVETIIQLAMAWSTYRTLASRRMSQAEIEAWIRTYYDRMLLA